jgi:dTDP-4-dehydrorhamnose reductase
MRILLLGGRGQLGSSLHASLASTDEVTAPTHQELDLRDLKELRAAAKRADLVINCAAYNAVDAAESDRAGAFAVNRDAVAALGESAPFLITFSTDYVFDDRDRPVTESDEPRPLSAYGESKLQGEQALDDARALIFRTAWVWTTTHPCFVSLMIKLAREKESLKVVHDQVGCPTYAPDLAEAVLGVIRKKDFRDARGVYHLAGAEPVSRYDLAVAAIERVPNRKVRSIEPVPTDAFPAAAKRPHRVVLDCSRARHDFGVSIPSYRDAFSRALPGST